MAVKLRLARHGRKSKPYYYIIATDSKSPRDGRFIERIGSYNPVTNPATIELDFDKALDWVTKGAQPTDTVKRILSYKGVLMKKHLLDGVRKGAFNEAEAEKRFTAWLEEKNSKITAKISDLSAKERAAAKAKLEAETKVKEERAQAIAKKYAAEAKEEAAEEEVAEETAEAQEEEAPVAEAAPEVEEVVEAPVAEEKTEEAPVEEDKKEE
ncbi:MAG: 30S ribosomal protein S16 [Bacteroidales bacterium]|nr:30S ribosomal protein S16 [Bacteroidales bacterium]